VKLEETFTFRVDATKAALVVQPEGLYNRIIKSIVFNHGFLKGVKNLLYVFTTKLNVFGLVVN